MLKEHRIREAIVRSMGPKPRRGRRHRALSWTERGLAATLAVVVAFCIYGAAHLAVSLLIASARGGGM